MTGQISVVETAELRYWREKNLVKVESVRKHEDFCSR